MSDQIPWMARNACDYVFRCYNTHNTQYYSITMCVKNCE